MNYKYAFLLAASLSSAVALSAQSKISLTGRDVLKAYATEMRVLGADQQAPELSVLVNLNPGATADQISAAGYEVVTDLDDILVVNLPVSRIQEFSQLPEVKYVDFGTELLPHMLYARPAGIVDEAHSGFDYEGVTHSYDGTGVICGIMDQGMDANHVNFKDADGNTRVERLWWFRGSTGNATQYTNRTIAQFTTDDNTQSHATHVAGIMAGAYKGTATVAKITNAQTGAGMTVGAADMPYYGVATGAKLAFSVGQFSQPNLIAGVTKIMDYAEEQGKPAVVNMSLGGNTGPHDGSSTYDQALSKLGERGIICMSAGNEGDSRLFVTKEFTDDNGDLKTMVTPSQLKATIAGYVDLWGQTDEVLEVSWALYSTSNRTLTTLASITGANQSANGNATFTSAFNGSLSMSSEVNPNNNRFHVSSMLYAISPKVSTSNLVLVVKYKEGEKVYVYGGGNQAGNGGNITFTNSGLQGYTNGSTEGTINDGACGNNIISVGASVSSKYAPLLSKSVASYGEGNPGTIASFSSYGYNFKGEAKPDVVAPGTAIVSSYSRSYVSKYQLGTNSLSATASVNNVSNAWGPMQGTSMSCPFVSGTVALWLQADPNQKYADIMDVIKHSSTMNTTTMRPAGKWGAGMINATEGLKYILGKTTGLGAVATDDPSKAAIVIPVDGGYDITVAGASSVNASIFAISGIEAARINVAGNSAVISTDGLNAGIYVLAVDTPAGRFTQKIAVK